MNEIHRLIAAAIYFLILSSFFYATYRSRNAAWKSFGFVYLIYSLPFLFLEFRHTYFGQTIDVTISVVLYSWLIIIAFTLNFLALLDSSFPKLSANLVPKWQRYGWHVSLMLIILAGIAFVNDLLFWGVDLFLRGTAARWAAEADHSNLFAISVDYILLLMAGTYGLFVWARNNENKWGARVSIALFLVAAFIGVMEGHRYYVAMLFLVWLIRPGLSRTGEGRRYALSLLVLPVVLFVAANVKILHGYVVYYEYVHEKGFVSYFYNNLSWYPSELTAIAANTVVGFSEGSVRAPHAYKYLAEFIPFSSRWLDFSEFSRYYGQIAEAATLSLENGQGTAFSFYLENIDTHLLIAGLFFVAALLWRAFPNPVVSIIMFNFSLNIIRNGAVVAISGLKVSLLVVCMVYVVLWLLSQIRHGGPTETHSMWSFNTHANRV